MHLTRIILCVQLLTLALLVQVSWSINIDDFGAKVNDTSYQTAINNGIAFNKAVIAANASATDKTVYVSAGKNYTILPAGVIDNIIDVTIQFDGIFNAWCGNVVDWPVDSQGNSLPLIYFSDTKGLIFRGQGVVDGNGYLWWWSTWVTGIDVRPNLFQIDSSIDTLVVGTTWKNAPQYHINWFDAANMTVRDLTVWVDIKDEHDPGSVPTFPLNTDGIDISGRDIYFTNLTVLNFDDAVAVKPMHKNQGKYTDCTQNILIENCYVKYGVGMSIGSVPPDPGVACIRNVTVRNVTFDKPFKAIYIKPNPAEDGTGIIDQITYENIEIHDALWWAIFIGTQQEHQPFQNGTGCSFLYPLPGTQCPTDPLITVSNITLRNVNIYGGLLSTGILICNETNPCTNFIFDNVNVYNRSDFPIVEGYLCDNVSGYARNSNLVPSCLKNLSAKDLPVKEMPAKQYSDKEKQKLMRFAGVNLKPVE